MERVCACSAKLKVCAVYSLKCGLQLAARIACN